MFRFSHMQQTTVCFLWRTTSLRVGGRAARRSCLTGPRRGGGGRLAGAAVLSCLVWRCELTARQVRSVSECVRRSHCATQHTPTQTRHRTHLSDGRADSIHTATSDTTNQSCMCRVWRGSVNWTIAIKYFLLDVLRLSCLGSVRRTESIASLRLLCSVRRTGPSTNHFKNTLRLIFSLFSA